jgi:SAM-dependent methyltransferase
MSELQDWFQSPPGQAARAWEQQCFDAALADVFGYHALQIGLPDFDVLAANRMPQRWLVATSPGCPNRRMVARTPGDSRPIALFSASEALPFGGDSLDLVALPHTLELSADPRATLREVHRVLVHEGHVAITGFNPLSLWAWRQRRARWYRHFGAARLYLPDTGEFIGMMRLRDWLLLLGFEIETTAFGCYQPAVRGVRSLARFGWMDRVGRRSWPMFGAVYFVLAVKRAPGARLIGRSWKKVPGIVAAPASVTRRQSHVSHHLKHENEAR